MRLDLESVVIVVVVVIRFYEGRRAARFARASTAWERFLIQFKISRVITRVRGRQIARIQDRKSDLRYSSYSAKFKGTVVLHSRRNKDNTALFSSVVSMIKDLSWKLLRSHLVA